MHNSRSSLGGFFLVESRPLPPAERVRLRVPRPFRGRGGRTRTGKIL